MKAKFLSVFLFIVLVVPFIKSSAQDVEIIMEDSVVYGNPGVLDMPIHIYIKNISSFNQTVFLVRTQNQLPENWSSSLCFDINCYPPDIDSVATTEAIHPGDTVDASVHFATDTVPGTAHVQIQIGTSHSSERFTINLTASTQANAVESTGHLNQFDLYQNYPNPFNPSTTINYTIPERSNVNLKVYDLTGREIATLVQEVQEAGGHSVNFNAEKLSSGVYFYKITAGQYSSVKKMILIK